MITKIADLLGERADSLLQHECKTISRDHLHIPSADWVDRIFGPSDRNPRVLSNLQRMFGTGRLANTGYLSILPVDQGIEHSAGASFAKNPLYFDPENIVRLALEGGCNAVASTFGVLGSVARRYAHRIPFLVKINHNELLTYPNQSREILFGTIKEAWNMGAAAVGATIYFGSEDATREIIEVSEAFAHAHELGMATVLWCYLRNPAFKKDKDYHVSADLTGQANHIGATIQADIVKQKLPENNGTRAGRTAAESAAIRRMGNLIPGFIPNSPRIIPSICADTRLRIPTWGARDSSTAAALRAKTISPMPLSPLLSTRERAAWASSPAEKPSSAR